jgi:hypothetical protein
MVATPRLNPGLHNPFATKGAIMITKERWTNFLIALTGGAVGALIVGTGGRLWQTRSAEAATGHVRHAARLLTSDDFVLVDRTGQKRAELHVVRGEPALEFYAPDGKTTRAWIGVDIRGVARARFFSAAGVGLAAIGATGDGKAGMALLDREQHLRATFDVSISGEPTLRLYDEKSPRIGLDITEAGSPGLALLDTSEKTRAALALAADGDPTLTLYDAGGNPIKSLP